MFEIGTRVRVLRQYGSGPEVGSVGTVRHLLSSSTSIGVEFPGWGMGHSLDERLGGNSNRDGYYFSDPEQYLEAISFSVGDRVRMRRGVPNAEIRTRGVVEFLYTDSNRVHVRWSDDSSYSYEDSSLELESPEPSNIPIGTRVRAIVPGTPVTNKVRCRINVATDATVCIGDSWPVSKTYTYPYYFTNNAYDNPLNYSEWILEYN